MKQAAIIALFGMLGVGLRYGLSLGAMKVMPTALPWMTFGINLTGAFFMGILYVLGIERSGISPELRTGLTLGLLGGFTTFSAYCIEAIRLWESGAVVQAALYYCGSPIFGLIACYSGVSLMRSVLT